LEVLVTPNELCSGMSTAFLEFDKVLDPKIGDTPAE
jgi:hypothetical protein